jgi:hypothetical protein
VSLWLRKAVFHATLLSGELSVAWLTAHGAVVRLPSSRLLMCDNVVCGSTIAGSAIFAVGHLVVCIVRVWVLKDHVPGVKEAWQETQTAESEVDERVSATEALLDPDAYGWELADVSVLESRCVADRWFVPATAMGACTYQDAQKHQKAVGTAHDDSDLRCRFLAWVETAGGARL